MSFNFFQILTSLLQMADKHGIYIYIFLLRTNISAIITTDLCGKEVRVNLGPVTGQLQHIQIDHTLFANKKKQRGEGEVQTHTWIITVANFSHLTDTIYRSTAIYN